MKHKFWIVLMAVAAALCMAFGLAGCGETQKGDKGDKGDDGVGIESMEVDENGHLIVTMTDGTKKDLGKITADGVVREEGTEGLQYQKRKDEAGNEYAAVVGLGTAWDTDIVIPSSFRGVPVKEITDNAFEVTEPTSPNNTLTSVVIPDSVTKIGDRAFYRCESLTSVKIGSGVTVIGDSAFYDCGLTEITLPDSVTEIGSSIFSSCESLTSVKIGSGVPVIGSYAFSGCGLTEVTIPDGVTEISERAFSYCESLTSIKIGSGVTVIGGYAFSGSGLTEITIPENVTEIGERAFGNCSKLEKIEAADGNRTYRSEQNCLIENSTGVLLLGCKNSTFPKGVTKIGAYAFSGSGLTEITIAEEITEIGERAFESCGHLTSVTIGNGVTEIGERAFESCDHLTSVTIGNGVTEIGDCAFANCNELQSVIWNAENCTKAGTPPENYFIGGKYGMIFAGCSSFKTLTIGRNVKAIPDSTFLECDSIETVIWNAENCTKAGSYNNSSNGMKPNGTIFERCYLQTITFGQDVKNIPDYAFYGCSGMEHDSNRATEITISASVTSIGNAAFDNCYNLKSVTFDGNSKLNSIGDFAFFGCSGLTEIAIPDSVASIGNYAFSNCSSLTEIAIPDSVASIGSYAFSNCEALNSVTIGSSVASIGSYAFSNCEALNSVTIGSSVTSIGSCAFYNCRFLRTVSFSNPTGWTAKRYGGDVEISGLEDPATAARCLTDTYSGYEWKRQG